MAELEKDLKIMNEESDAYSDSDREPKFKEFYAEIDNKFESKNHDDSLVLKENVNPIASSAKV